MPAQLPNARIDCANPSPDGGRKAIPVHKIDTAAAVRPLKLITPPEHYVEQVDIEHEIETIEPLLFILRRFVEQLARRLEAIYLVTGEFQLSLGLASGAECDPHQSAKNRTPGPCFPDRRAIARFSLIHPQDGRSSRPRS